MSAAIFAATAAIAAMIASFVSYFEMRAANKANTASVFLYFGDKYDSPEITNALRELIVWWRRAGDNFADVWFQAFEEGEQWALDLNHARRSVNRYFDDLVRTYEAGLVSKNLSRLLVSRFGLLVYYDIIVPMNRAMFGETYLDRSQTLRKIGANYNGITQLAR